MSRLPAPALTALLVATIATGQPPDDRRAEAFITGLDVLTPEVAEAALVVEDQTSDPGSGRMLVTVRNHDWRSITAWSIGFVFGTGGGNTLRASMTVDHHKGSLRGAAPEKHSPIRPGDSRVLEYDLLRGYSTLEHDRFEHSDYSVVATVVEAVVFDDGSFAGSNLESLQSIFAMRYARALALSQMLARLDSAVETENIQPLFQSLSQIDRLGRKFPPGAADRPFLPDLIRSEANALGDQWLSVLHKAAPDHVPFGTSAATAKKAFDDAPETMREAARATRHFMESEFELVIGHLPEALRDEVARLTQETVERFTRETVER